MFITRTCYYDVYHQTCLRCTPCKINLPKQKISRGLTKNKTLWQSKAFRGFNNWLYIIFASIYYFILIYLNGKIIFTEIELYIMNTLKKLHMYIIVYFLLAKLSQVLSLINLVNISVDPKRGPDLKCYIMVHLHRGSTKIHTCKLYC